MPNPKRVGRGARRIQPPGPPKKPDNQIVLPHQLPLYRVVVRGNSSNINLKGGGGQPTLQPLLQKGKHSSDRTSPWVLLVRGTPFDKQVPLQSIGHNLPQRNRPGRGCHEEHEFPGNQVLLGQYGATNKTCSSSSLILHSVCASRLTGGDAYLHRPRGQLCASASVPSVIKNKTIVKI